jgi:hypothetical protein
MTAKRSLVAAVVIAAVVAWSSSAPAEQRFSDKSLKGAWGFNAHGFLAGGTVPASAMGRNTYDGNGGCFSESRLNAGGTVLALASLSCTYTVNPDGTGVQQTTFTAGVFTTHFVLVDNAKEFLFIVSDTAQPGTTIASGVAKRQ